MIIEAKEILEFWLGTVGPDGWEKLTPDQDTEIKDRFEGLYNQARDGALASWVCEPESCLALILLLDQFPRAMFRGKAQAYETDGAALALAKRAIVMGHDLSVREPGRLFFYTPMMHSESLMDQERCVRLVALRLPNRGKRGLLHAKAHRDVIRQFGRFPHRNAAVGRATSDLEADYLSAGGYALTKRSVAA